MESGNERPIDWKLLTRYVAGTCSEEEEVLVDVWAAADPQSRQLLEDLREAWKAAGPEEEDAPQVDVDAAWNDLSQQVREAEERGPAVPPDGPRPARPGASGRSRKAASSRPRSSASRRWRRAGGAAAAVLTLAVALLFLNGRLGGGQAPESKVFVTRRGQRAVIDLIDGTRVRLNADSRLTIPGGGFAGDRREVRLDGEAYFDVARDTTRPFRVRTATATVRVLGTAFNVRAYGADAAPMQVAVTDGEVALQASDDGPGDIGTGDTLRLLPRQIGIAGAGGALRARRDVDLSAYLAWTEGRLVFEDAPFQEVVRTLERWYDLQIEVRAPRGGIDHLNAHFDDESLQETLSDIAVALNLRYDRTGSAVTFYRPAARPAASSVPTNLSLARPSLARPSLARPSLARPSLARPSLAR